MSDDNTDQPGATIDICENGPLIVNIAADADGKRIEPGAALCRCGESKNKPYCDGSHNTTGFKDAGAVEPKGAADSATAETLTVKFAAHGPILCTGPLTVRSADGTAVHAGLKAALCRCGASATKPFCDGTHGKIGFDSD